MPNIQEDYSDYLKDPKKLLSFKQAATNKDKDAINALYNIGIWLLQNINIQEASKIAEDCLTIAAEQGNHDAQFALVYAYLYNYITVADELLRKNLIEKWVTEAADHEHHDATFLLGWFHLQNYFSRSDHVDRAEDCLIVAATNYNHAVAQLELGLAYLYDRIPTAIDDLDDDELIDELIVENNPDTKKELAKKYLHKAADQNDNKDAQFALYKAYSNHLLALDFEEFRTYEEIAIEYLSKAAYNKHPEALNYYLQYLNGNLELFQPQENAFTQQTDYSSTHHTHTIWHLQQTGWNCFDIAVNFAGCIGEVSNPSSKMIREHFVDFALHNSSLPRFRNLVWLEIKSAFLISHSKNFKYDNNDAYGLPLNMLAIFQQEEDSQPQWAKEIIDFYNQYEFATSNSNDPQIKDAVEEAFNDCFKQEEIYKAYVNGYYKEQHDWFVLQPIHTTEAAGYTSMIDIASLYINKAINIYELQSNGDYKLLCSTGDLAQNCEHIVHVQYSGNNHFTNIDNIFDKRSKEELAKKHLHKAADQNDKKDAELKRCSSSIIDGIRESIKEPILVTPLHTKKQTISNNRNLKQTGWACLSGAINFANYVRQTKIPNISLEYMQDCLVNFALENSEKLCHHNSVWQEIKVRFLNSHRMSFALHPNGLPKNMLHAFKEKPNSKSKPAWATTIISTFNKLNCHREYPCGNPTIIDDTENKFNECFQQIEVYKEYINGYYQQQNDWSLFQQATYSTKATGYTSMIDIAALYIGKTINIYNLQSDGSFKLLYSTDPSSEQNHENIVHVQHFDDDHFTNIDSMFKQMLRMQRTVRGIESKLGALLLS